VTRVTIVGAGNMGRGIGTRVVAGGHQVEIVDRDPADARRLAEDLGGSAAALDPGAPFGGEVVVFAVYYPGIKDAVRQYADQLAGKAVVDITNPVDTQTHAAGIPCVGVASHHFNAEELKAGGADWVIDSLTDGLPL
jgi:predicted dinucleotide-binding enzyme